MRKLVIFLVVFGVGLALLLWIQGRRVRPADTHSTSSTQGELPARPNEFTEVPVAGGAREAKQIDVLVRGPIEHRQRDEKLRDVYYFRDKDTKPIGADAYDLIEFEATTYDPESHAVRAEVRADRARVRLDPKETGIDPNYPITLNGAIATIRRDLPLVPIEIRVPIVEGTIQEQTLLSEERVDIRGVGLVAHGVGLVVDGRERRFTLKHDTNVEIDLEGGVHAHVSSKDGLTFRRLPDVAGSTDQQIEIEATTLAHVDLIGDGALHVDGDRIVLHGTLPSEKSDVHFSPKTIDAHGSVKLTTENETFSGDEAELAFAPDGKPSHARLIGHPHAVGPVAAPADLVQNEKDRRELTVDAEGAGPLDVDLGAERRFDFQGPVIVHIPDLGATLKAGAKLSGIAGADKRFRTLEVTGGAVLDMLHIESLPNSLEGHLEAEALDLTSTLDAGGNSVASLKAKGVAHANGILRDQRAYQLDTQNGIEIVRSADDIRVPRADGVALRVFGEKGFSASADVLKDFDANTLTFDAEGSIHLSNDFGDGRGDRLVALENGLFQLSGAPATIAFAEGDAHAKFLEYDTKKLVAREDSHAHVVVPSEDADTPPRDVTLDGRWLQIERDISPVPGGKSRVSLDGRTAVHAVVKQGPETWELRSEVLRVRGEQAERDQLEPQWLEAKGGVELDYTADYTLHGTGERFLVDQNKIGHLEPRPGELTELGGVLPKENLTFNMKSARVDFTPSQLDAVNAAITIDGVAMPLSAPSKSDASRHMRAVAGHMTCDRNSILFTDSVYLGGVDPGERNWSLDAEQALITATKESSTPGDAPSGDVLAWGNCVARLGVDIEAHGESMRISRAENRASLHGSPAWVESPTARWESNRLEWNLATNYLRTSSGVVRSPRDDTWRLEYESLDQVEGADETIQVLREPKVTTVRGKDKQRTTELTRAGWMLFWVDQHEWSRVTGRFYNGTESPPTMTTAEQARRRKRRETPSLFTLLEEQTAFAGLLDEVYMEGNVESYNNGERVARADTVYLDYVDGHGWVQNVEIETPMSKFDERTKTHRNLKLHAKWLRHSADGSFLADDAQITSCEYDEPHYEIQSGDLRIEPSRTHLGTWDVSIRHNAIQFSNGLRFPLPRIAFPMKPKTKIEPRDVAEKGWSLLSVNNLAVDMREASIGGIRWLSIGTQARFGTFIGTEIDFEPGAWLKWLDRWLSGGHFGSLAASKLDEPDGGTSISPKYLNKRGLLLGLETALHRDGVYDLDVNVDGIVDGGEDKGLVRVADSDRSALRAWIHARGRYFYDKDTWLDVVFSEQTDAGVQAEFFENDFLHFEERETYVHWRKSDDGSYWSATVEARVDDFRTEVLDSPAFDFFRGRSEIGHLGDTPLLYTSNTSLAYLTRLEGNPLYEAPFADGLGSRSSARFDTVQRVEAPKPIGFGGLVATPFVEGHGTFWQTGADPSESPTRAALISGVDLATTFWRMYGSNYLHEVTPEIGVRSDLADEASGGSPVRFDGTERPLEGDFVDMRLRSRLENTANRNFLDLEFAQTYASDTALAEPFGWLPFETSAIWSTDLGHIPFVVTHDGRYDWQHADTVYSRSALAFRPIDRLDLEAGYNSARKLDDTRLYDAITIGARFRPDANPETNKWEIEGRETISQASGQLASSVTLRRFGHDFVFEFAFSFVAGEGSNSFSVNFLPLLGYHPSNLALLDRWRSEP